MQNDTHKPEATFRAYNSEQAKRYAAGRATYRPQLYDVIFSHHTSTGGQFERVVDIGCGTGQATNELAKHFDYAWGLDPGTAMLDLAKEISVDSKTKAGHAINWQLSSAEDVDKLVDQGMMQEQSVDMITVAMAAHWFDMSKFWPQCARLLRPGGTVAIWCLASSFPYPHIPNYDKLKEIMLDFELRVLGPYTLEGNMMARDMYKDLKLPWQLDPPEKSFPESEYFRKEWDRDGVLSATEPKEGQSEVDFFSESKVLTLEEWGMVLDTPSQVTRWRKAHPELAGTENDCTKVCLGRLRQALKEVGEEEKMRIGCATGLLMLKKR